MRRHHKMRVYGTHRAKKASVALAFVGVALASAACGGSAKPKPTPTPLPCASGQTGVACPPPPSTPTPTPPGLPSDWSSRAIQAATTKLTNCAQATSLNPDGCPNQALANSSTVEAVHWTVLNGPLADAVAAGEARRLQPGEALETRMWGVLYEGVEGVSRLASDGSVTGIRP